MISLTVKGITDREQLRFFSSQIDPWFSSFLPVLNLVLVISSITSKIFFHVVAKEMRGNSQRQLPFETSPSMH